MTFFGRVGMFKWSGFSLFRPGATAHSRAPGWPQSVCRRWQRLCWETEELNLRFTKEKKELTEGAINAVRHTAPLPGFGACR